MKLHLFQALAWCGICSLAWGQGAADRHPLYEPSVPQTKKVEIQGGLQVAVLSEFDRTELDKVPGTTQPALKLRGWRGERVSGRLAAWSKGNEPQLTVNQPLLVNEEGDSIDVKTGMLRYTAAHGKLYADVMGNENVCDLAAGQTRSIWVQVDIPQDAEPGVYRGSICVYSAASASQQIPFELEVEDLELPEPADWNIYLDLWQHPQAVARWHQVEPWSPEHMALLKPLMKRLADAGQKVVTCTIIDEAWNAQTYDWFPSLVRWVRGKDGVMRYDYSAFDTWVEFMMDEIGIKEQISCYTMVPWSMSVRYFDESTGVYLTKRLSIKDASFEQMWGPFLRDFRKHLKRKGWLEKTCIALDERPDALMLAAQDALQKYAPELRIVSAVDRPSDTTRQVYLISPVVTHADSVTSEMLAERKANGKKTSFYVCLHPQHPNTFTMSPHAEAEWLGVFAAARGYDGFLRWAYNSWNRNPFETTDFVHWPSGDCYLVYPGNLSSRRFEHLRDGLEDYEKISILRARAKELDTPEAGAAIERLNAELASLFTVERSKGSQHEQDVLRARELIRETAAILFR